MDKLEQVQKRTTKMIPGIRLLFYQYRLARLNLSSLQRRRLRYDIVEVYKMLNGLNKIDVENLFFRDVNSGRGHSFKLL